MNTEAGKEPAHSRHEATFEASNAVVMHKICQTRLQGLTNGHTRECNDYTAELVFMILGVSDLSVEFGDAD